MAMKYFICEVIKLVLCEYFLVVKLGEYTYCYQESTRTATMRGLLLTRSGLSRSLRLSLQQSVASMAGLVLRVL